MSDVVKKTFGIRAACVEMECHGAGGTNLFGCDGLVLKRLEFRHFKRESSVFLYGVGSKSHCFQVQDLFSGKFKRLVVFLSCPLSL
jgi:hypothetical protein